MNFAATENGEQTNSLHESRLLINQYTRVRALEMKIENNRSEEAKNKKYANAASDNPVASNASRIFGLK